MATPSQRKKTLVVSAPARETVDVKVAGVVYPVTRPKSIVALEISTLGSSIDSANPESVTEALDKINLIVDSLFGAKAEDVRKRLRDPKDTLDLTEIVQTANVVTEHFTKDTPTT